jgi:hypothetical protein
MFPPVLRKLGLTLHVAVSVGWLGAAAVFLCLAILALTTPDPALARGIYLAMEPAARYALVPFALAAVVTGIVQSLGTRWGLFRHYWVVFKLVLALGAAAVLLHYTGTFGEMARAAADPETPLQALQDPSPVLHAALAVLVLVTTTVLAVFKPRGLTRYGWNRQQKELGRVPDEERTA